MSDKINLTVNEYHDSVFREFWLNSYSPRVHHIDESVGAAFDRLLVEYKKTDIVLGSPKSFLFNARSFLHNVSGDTADRAIAEYYEFCYRKKHSLFDPSTKVPAPSGLWKITSSQVVGSEPVFQKESRWKKRLAKVFAWLLYKILSIGFIALIIGFICLFDVRQNGYGPVVFCFAITLTAGVFFVADSIWHIRDNADFIGDVKYDIVADPKQKDFTELGVLVVANNYFRYIEEKYGYLGIMQRRILALYLTSVYFKPFLRGQKPYTTMHQIIKSCMSLKYGEIINFSPDMRSFTYKFTQEQSWATICAACVNFFCYGMLKLKLDPYTGIDSSDYDKLIQKANVTSEKSVHICESDFAYIEPLLNETHSEQRFNKIFDLADLSLTDWESYIVSIAKSRLRSS